MKTIRSAHLVAVLALVCASLAGCSLLRSAETGLTPGIFFEPDTRAVLPEGVEIRKVYSPGVELTKASEGFRAHLYDDAAGYCTIGYGHLIKKQSCDGTEPHEFRSGLTHERGTEILRKDMEKAEIAVMTLTRAGLTDGQYAALCDFVFNVGSGNYKNSTLRQVVEARQHDRVPAQLRRWVRAGGKVYRGLQARREKEIELFFEGVGVPRGAPREGEDLSPIDIRSGEL